MGIVETFFEEMRGRGFRFKNMRHMLHLFLDYLDLSHQDLTTQNNKYDFIRTLKEHVKYPLTYRLRDYRKHGLYDTRILETDMDTDSDSSELCVVMND